MSAPAFLAPSHAFGAEQAEVRVTPAISARLGHDSAVARGQTSTVGPRLRARLPPFLASRLSRDLGAAGGAQIAIRLSRLLTTVLVARALSPEDFGLAAAVLTVYELMSLFTRNGIIAAVVRATNDEVQSVALTARTMVWILCGALAVIQAAIAVPIALAWHDIRLALPIAAMGAIYLASPPCAVQTAFLQREGRIARIATTGAVQVVTDNLLTAVLALCGLGFWAIVLPKLLVAPIWPLGIRAGYHWHADRWSLHGWRDIARFSRSVLGIELLGAVQANIDYLIVGMFLGVQALGTYYFAFNAGLGISLGLVNAFGLAVFPYLCAVRQEPAELARRYRRTCQILGWIVVPLVLAQAALAPIYVPLVFGVKWAPAVPVLAMICLSALARPFALVCSQLLKAAGRPEIELRWQCATTAALIIGLVAGTVYGILGVAVAVLLVQSAFLSAFVFRASRAILRDRPVAP